MGVRPNAMLLVGEARVQSGQSGRPADNHAESVENDPSQTFELMSVCSAFDQPVALSVLSDLLNSVPPPQTR
jgi:hypothetical protein